MNVSELRETIAGGEDSYYVRTTSGRRQASREELLRLYQAALALFPDELPVPGATVEDLDQGYFERSFETFAEMPIEDVALSMERLLTNLKLWDGTALTVAGLLLFGRNPQAHLPFAMISAVHFKGNEIGEEFLDRIEIMNPGRLPNTVTLDNILLGIHAERNPILVTFLSRLGFVSRIGTGIPRMIRLMREHGLPAPEFRIVNHEFRVVLRRSGERADVPMAQVEAG